MDQGVGVGVGVDDLVLQSVLQSRLPPPDLYPLHFRSLVSVAQVDDSAAVSSPTNCVVTLLHQQHNTDAQSKTRPAQQASAPGLHPGPCSPPPQAPPLESHAQLSVNHSSPQLLGSCALELKAGPSRSSLHAAFQT